MQKKINKLLLVTFILMTFNQNDKLSFGTSAESIIANGFNTQIEKISSNEYQIINGEHRGNNLYHSFEKFNIFEGNSVTFLSEKNIQNIISRVTGGSKSIINGILKANTTNFILINPYGIYIGPNAKLDHNSNYFFLNVDYIKFEDGIFNKDSDSTTLSCSTPSSFGFIDDNIISSIEIDHSKIILNNNNSISFIGKEIYLTGNNISLISSNISINDNENIHNTNDDVLIDAKGGINLISNNSEVNITDISKNGDINIINCDLYSDNKSDLVKIDINANDLYINNSIIGTKDEDGNEVKIDINANDLYINNSIIGTKDEDGNEVKIDINANNLYAKDSTIGSEIERENNVHINISALDTIKFDNSNVSSIIYNTSIQDRKISLKAKNIFFNNSNIYCYSDGGAKSGDISINATEQAFFVGEKTTIDNSMYMYLNTQINEDVGNISIEAKMISFLDGAGISSSLPNGGNGGNIVLNATEYITISNSKDGKKSTIHAEISKNSNNFRNNESNTQESNNGNAGKISLKAKKITIDSEGIISAESTGDGTGGSIKIEADNVNIQNNAKLTTSTTSSGNAGEIIVKANNFTLNNNSEISSSSTMENQNGGLAGNIDIFSNNFNLQNQSIISTSTNNTGNAGKISIRGNSFTINNKSEVKSSSTMEKQDGGLAGEIDINVANFTISNDSKVSTLSMGEGTAGNININSNKFTVKNSSMVTSENLSTNFIGDAGKININLNNNLNLLDNSKITTKSEKGAGGQIEIKGGKFVHSYNSQITSSVVDAGKDGGDILVQSDNVVLNHSEINADADVGNGGNIQITSKNYIENKSNITAHSNKGIDGNINISFLDDSIDSGIEILPDNYLDAAPLLNSICEKRDAETVSRFIVEQRDGLPSQFDDWHKSLQFLPDFEKNYKNTFLNPEIFSDIETHLKNGNIIQGIKKFEENKHIFNNKPIPISTLISIIDAYQSTGHHKTSLSLLCEALPEEIYNTCMVQTSNRSISYTFDNNNNKICMNQSANSILSYTPGEIMPILPDLYKDKDKEKYYALYFSTFGDVWLTLGYHETADKYAQKALSIAEKLNDNDLLCFVLNNSANAIIEKTKYTGAFRAYSRCLKIISKNKNSSIMEPLILMNSIRLQLIRGFIADSRIVQLLNHVYIKAMKLEKSNNKALILMAFNELAMSFFEKFIEIQSSKESFHNFPEIMRIKEICYNALIETQKIAKELNNKRILSYTLGNIAKIYEKEKKYKDALKLTKLAQYAVIDYYCPEIKYKWHWQIGRLLKAQNKYTQARKSFDEAIKILNKIKKEFYIGYRNSKINAYNKLVRPVYIDKAEILLTEADKIEQDNNSYEEKIIDAIETIDDLKYAELQNFYEDECLTLTNNSNNKKWNPDKNTAMLYPIVFHNKIRILLQIQDKIINKNVDINYEKFSQIINDLNQNLKNYKNNQDYLTFSQELYKILIEPVDKELAINEINTIIYSPDGILRLIPLCVLHDEKQFMIEKFAIATLLAKKFINPDNSSLKEARILLAGLSKSRHGFNNLPNVENELNDIIKQKNMKGQIFLDEDFTCDKIIKEFKNNKYPIIHMSTHGFFGKSLKDTFIITYDNKFSMNSLEKLIELSRYKEKKVELLTLSACQTAFGDERSALGLAGIAVKAGVKTAVASLWFIDDKATSIAMKNFYKNLNNSKKSKAEALQLAQINLIKKSKKYNHPIFWAPFLIIGNWM